MKRMAVIQAILAAILFGTSAPLSKLMLGAIDPIPLAGLLYIGSGLGGIVLGFIQKMTRKAGASEPPLTRPDIPWLVGAIISGGIAAPIVLMSSLIHTPAATASLLLNFENIATALIAVLIFKEALNSRIISAIMIVTAASIMLAWTGNNEWGFSLGAIGIIAACLFWGLDNNLTRKISIKNPLTIVTIKGLSAGIFSILLSVLLNKPLPTLGNILIAIVIGAFCYGLSIYLFIHAMRSLGAARTSILFGTAPFVGALLSLVILKEQPAYLFWLSLPIMLVGAWLMLSEDHQHLHTHETLQHEHIHSHDDHHQTHPHPDVIPVENTRHSHWHVHDPITHSHQHTPDIHHRHQHSVMSDR